jgi:hypothetical protein
MAEGLEPPEPLNEDRANNTEELKKVNAAFAQLVQILIERIEGEDQSEYAYSFREGWKEKKEDDIQSELQSEDLDAQLREIQQLIEKYRQQPEDA